MEQIGQKHIKIDRKCRECGLICTEENIDKFAKSKVHRFGIMNWCKNCKNAFQRNSIKVNQSKGVYQHAKRYGISSEEYKKCMNTSVGCQICGSIKELCYDHDHSTMEFRGVLCRSCNKAIGALGDTEEGVRKALSYLVYHYHPDLFNKTSISSSFKQEYLL